MRKLGSKKRFALIATTTAAVLVGSGVAVAFWTTSGSGSGGATTGTTTALTVTQTNTIGNMYPGMTAVPIDISVANADANPQSITSLTVSIDDSAFPVGCTAADYAVTNGAIPGGPNNVAASGSTAFSGAATGASIAMINSPSNQNACKGVSVPLNFSVS